MPYADGMVHSERANPFYFLLLFVSLAFAITAVGYAVIPVLEQKAAEVGNPAPPSPLRAALRRDGWLWLLVELVLMAVFGLLSMGLDRLRTLQKERAAGTIPPTEQDAASR